MSDKNFGMSDKVPVVMGVYRMREGSKMNSSNWVITKAIMRVSMHFCNRVSS